jgi:hypothetical protein
MCWAQVEKSTPHCVAGMPAGHNITCTVLLKSVSWISFKICLFHFHYREQTGGSIGAIVACLAGCLWLGSQATVVVNRTHC